jgi:DNA-binding MarR family transcriptional regulator
MSEETAQQTLERSERLIVRVSLGDATAEFSGSPQIVLQSINSFISKTVPEIDLAKKLSMNFSTRDLVEKFKDYVRITPEGPRILSDQTKLSDKELIALQLVANRIASETRAGSSPWLSLSLLQETTSLNPKTLSSRLSELAKAGYVTKETIDDKSQFKISTIGIDWLSSLLVKK